MTVTGTTPTTAELHGGKKYRGAAIGGTMGYSDLGTGGRGQC